MTVLPSVSGKELLATLRRAGFEVVRVKGSHHFLRHADGRTTVVPVHSGETIGADLLSKILRDCDLSRDQLHKLLQLNRGRKECPMAEFKYRPIRHDHEAFLGKARKRRGFKAAYDALAVEYAAAGELLAAHPRAGCDIEIRLVPRR